MTGHVVSIAIEIDLAQLTSYTDAHLAMLWHLAQANPASFNDRQAGELAEKIGREIICRWLGGVAPELWNHQGHSYYWSQLTRFATYRPGGTGGVGDPDWHKGTWVAKQTAADEPAKDGGSQIPDGDGQADAPARKVPR